MADLPEGFAIDQPSDEAPSGTSGRPPAGFVMDEHPSYGATESGLEGYLKGASANWRDEIYGASKASGLPDVLGGFRAPVGAARVAYEHYTQPQKGLSDLVTGKDNRGWATKEYERARDEKRAQEQEMQRQNPTAFGAGELGGSMASVLAAPEIGLTRQAVARLGPVAGRIAGSAAAGAGYGALAGAGEGEGATGTGMGAVTGGVTGTALGTVGGAAAEALSPLVSPIMKKASSIYHGLADPEAEAIRRYGQAAERDVGSAGEKLTPQDLQLAQHVGMSIGAIDTSGQGVRELARTAANFSPEAQAALKQFTQDRFEEQSPRIAGFIRQITGGADAASDAGAIEAAARAANRPAYKAAYQAGDTGIWTPELERLSGIPPVRRAMEKAVENSRTWAGAEGYGAFNPGVTFENGVMQFGRGKGAPPYPNMQYWDYVQRELRDMKETAGRTGEKGMATALGSLHKQLVGELDAAVPEFQAARRGAAAFFGADNALEAGSKFVRPPASMTPKDQIAQHRALARMNPAEKELFARGYASRLADEVERAGDNRNVLLKDFFNSKAGRERTQLALQPGRAQQLEALLRIEGIVDQSRTVLGNSTTARQMAAMAAFGAGGDYALEGHFDPSHMVVAALTGAGLPHAYQQVGQLVSRRVATQLGRLLTSNNPVDLAKGAKIAARDAAVMQRLRQLTAGSIRGIGTEAVETSGQRPKQGFKHGGVASWSEGKKQDRVMPAWWVKAKAGRERRARGGRAEGGMTDGDSDPASGLVRTNSPVFNDPQYAPLSSLQTRSSPSQQWESAIEEQHQRDLRKPSKGEQIADILGKTVQVAGAPIINHAKRMQSAFEHGIDWGNTEQVKETSGGTLLDMMGLAGGSAIPRVARTGGADTTLGMFFAAPKATAVEAEKMLAAGADAKGVWNKLGVFQGKDGHWRTEATGPSSMRAGWQPGDLLPQAVDQPHVYANEPAAKQVFMDQMTTGANNRAEYFPYDKRYQTPADAQIAVAPGGVGKPGELEDIQHETQHFLQNRHGWSFQEENPRADWETYHQSASEVEARNSAAREARWREISAAQGPEAAEKWRVENPPWTTEDVPREQQHVSYGQQGYGSSAVKTPPAMMDAARKAAPWAKGEETTSASALPFHPDQQRELIQSLYGDASAERDAAQRAAGANWTHEMEKEQGVWLVKDPAERKRMGLPEIPVPPPPAAPVEAAPAASRGWLSSLVDRAQPAAEAAPKISDLDREMLQQGANRKMERRLNDLPPLTSQPASAEALMNPAIAKQGLAKRAEDKAGKVYYDTHRADADATEALQHETLLRGLRERGEAVPSWAQNGPTRNKLSPEARRIYDEFVEKHLPEWRDKRASGGRVSSPPPFSTRRESNYSPTRGKPDHHCGADAKWPRGACEHYMKPNKCRLVAGFIAAHGGCSWWSKAKEIDKDEAA